MYSVWKHVGGQFAPNTIPVLCNINKTLKAYRSDIGYRKNFIAKKRSRRLGGDVRNLRNKCDTLKKTNSKYLIWMYVNKTFRLLAASVWSVLPTTVIIIKLFINCMIRTQCTYDHWYCNTTTYVSLHAVLSFTTNAL